MPQAPRIIREDNWQIVMLDDLRPAGDGKHCFYCGEVLETPHKQDCVIRLHQSYYHVALCLNETGEIRMYRNDMAWGEHDHFSWTENNYSCDCNRHLFFLRADGIEPGEEDWERDCSDGKYSALYAELPDGTRIELDPYVPSAGCNDNE